MTKIELQFEGKGTYKSSDHVTGAAIAVKAGDVVALSPEKAAQVLRDFPAEWRKVGVEVADPTDGPAAAVPQPAAPVAAAPEVAPAPEAAPAPAAKAPKKKGPARR